MNKDYFNGGYGNNNPSSSWNATDGPDIGVWNPETAAGVTGQPNNYGTTNNPNYDGYSEWRAPQNPASLRQSSNQLYHAQGDMNSDWRTGQNTPISNSNLGPQYNSEPLPNNYQQQGISPANFVTNTPGMYNQQPLLDGLQGYSGFSNDNPQLQYNGAGGNGNYVHGTSERNIQFDSWSSPSVVPDMGQEQGMSSFGNPGTFVNPLMDSSDKVASAADLVKNMHIEGRKAEMKMNERFSGPTYISKSSLAMLKQNLDQAAEIFSSPEALTAARERELGLSNVDDIATNVIVSNLSVNAAHFVPRSKSPRRQTASAAEESAVITGLTSLITNVLTQPGNFDMLSEKFVKQVQTCIHSEETVKKMVDLIFNKAISEDNFKYLGAKLCDKLTAPEVLKSFRTIFLNQLQKEFKNIDSLFDTAMEENTARIQGFVSFMAEIFIHIKVNGNPLTALGKSLCRFLDKLLTKPAENVAFVCKMLKLTGSKLRDALTKDNMEIYENVFTSLKKIAVNQGDNDEKTKRLSLLISSVSRLKDTNWGRTNSNTRKKSSIADPEEYGDKLSEVDQNYYMNEPVFFTPDGVQYTAAEAQIPEFYDQHLAKFNLKKDPSEEGAVTFPWNSKDQYFDDFVPSDEEDEFFKSENVEQDYDQEFEKFLAESGQL